MKTLRKLYLNYIRVLAYAEFMYEIGIENAYNYSNNSRVSSCLV